MADPVIAVAIDEALALRLLADDARIAGAGRKKGTPGAPIPAEQRYATDADYADDAPRGKDA